jgi:outer membrane protein assembly factor BamB
MCNYFGRSSIRRKLRMKKLYMVKRWVFALAIAGILLISPLGAVMVSTAPEPNFEIKDLTESVGMGFGDNLNKYAWSMAYFEGHLYVGTLNVSPLSISPVSVFPSIASGAEIWRLEDETTREWTKVLDLGDASSDDQENIGFREMREYNGKLYAGSFSLLARCAIWESEDGLTWTKLKTFDGNSIRGSAVYDGKLFIGTSGVPEVWSFDGNDFTKIYSNDGTSTNQTFAGFADIIPTFAGFTVFEDNLYFTEWSTHGQRLLRYDGKRVKQMLESYDGHFMMTLKVFNGCLYIGSAGLPTAQSFYLKRSANPDDPDSWETIVGEGGIYPAGFGYRDNLYAWNMEEYKGRLYLGTLKFFGPAQLWVSDDGVNWEKIFEADSNMQYGIRELKATDEALYIGTAYNVLSPCVRDCGLQVFKLISY